MAIDVDCVETGDEVDKDVVYTLGDLLEKGSGNFGVRWVFRFFNRNEKLLGLCVDITDIDTTFVGEQDPVALSRTGIVSMDKEICRLRKRSG